MIFLLRPGTESGVVRLASELRSEMGAVMTAFMLDHVDDFRREFPSVEEGTTQVALVTLADLVRTALAPMADRDAARRILHAILFSPEALAELEKKHVDFAQEFSEKAEYDA